MVLDVISRGAGAVDNNSVAAVTAEVAHTLAHVVEVVVEVEEGVLVGAVFVLARTADLVGLIRVLKDLRRLLLEAEGPVRWWDVRHDILVVSVAPLVCDHLVSEGGVFFVADAGLTEVEHLVHVDSLALKSHSRQLRKRSTERVTSSLDLGSGVDRHQGRNVRSNLVLNGLNTVLEPVVHVALALGEGAVRILVGVEVSNKVFDVVAALEHHVDRVVRWQIPNETLSAVRLLINSISSDEACSVAEELVGHVLVVAAVSVDGELAGDLSLLQAPARPTRDRLVAPFVVLRETVSAGHGRQSRSDQSFHLVSNNN